ncbi:MAG: cyclase family protein [Bifidobacteriaceae bacterium]|jgi:hypothetical protein|nr:cyclase family protein [Bifidobacteriaceae bacterium]
MNYLDWIRNLGASAPHGDRLGSLRRLGADGRLRAIAAIRTGDLIPLGRELVAGKSIRGDSNPAFEVRTFYSEEPVGTWPGPGSGTGTDHLRIDCHGIGVTHIDALNHTALDHTWYGGVSVRDQEVSSSWEQGDGVLTRGLYLDLARLRDRPWVDAALPVTGAEIARALEGAGLSIEEGDALVLNMGRDRFEAAGNTMAGSARPGLGEDAARWLADRPISLLCWDFLDAKNNVDPPACVHLLNWAQGLVLVDNCDFAKARSVLDDPVRSLALVVAPLRMRGATGCAVNPMMIA